MVATRDGHHITFDRIAAKRHMKSQGVRGCLGLGAALIRSWARRPGWWRDAARVRRQEGTRESERERATPSSLTPVSEKRGSAGRMRVVLKRRVLAAQRGS